MRIDEGQIIEITVEEYSKNETINAFELGYFLYFFRSAYVACLKLAEDDSILQKILSNSEEFNSRSLEKLEIGEITLHLNKKVVDLWMTDLDVEFDLEFVSISKDSPLKFKCNVNKFCLVALTLAVIISGGKADIYKGTFELPPLAVGIRALKDAFDQPQPNSLPSELKGQKSDDKN